MFEFKFIIYYRSSGIPNKGIHESDDNNQFTSRYCNEEDKLIYSYYYDNDKQRLQGFRNEPRKDHRMYHIQITSTSDEYVIGRPKLDANGHTMGGEDNAKVVSLSFMSNSQLGAITSGVLSYFLPSGQASDYVVPEWFEQNKDWLHGYADHYVEVFIDSKGQKCVYRDWRLPTLL